jgi:predicted RNA methylase
MIIERRTPEEYKQLRECSKAEWISDAFVLLQDMNTAMAIGNLEKARQRLHQATVVMIVKDRKIVRRGGIFGHIESEIEPHSMPYYVLKRVLGAIPRQEIEGKRIMDLFAGHGAIHLSLMYGGLSGDCFPERIMAVDKDYAREGLPSPEGTIDIQGNWGAWGIEYAWLAKELGLSAVDLNVLDVLRNRRRIIYSNSSALALKFNNECVDTVIADPPFGELTRQEDPERLLLGSLSEVKRVLVPEGRAYYLMPHEWTDRIIDQSPLRGKVIRQDVGRTWFPIALVRFDKLLK